MFSESPIRSRVLPGLFRTAEFAFAATPPGNVNAQPQPTPAPTPERLQAQSLANELIAINDQAVRQYNAEQDPVKRDAILREEQETTIKAIEPHIPTNTPPAIRGLAAEKIAQDITPINIDAQNRLRTATQTEAQAITAERQEKIAGVLEPNLAAPTPTIIVDGPEPNPANPTQQRLTWAQRFGRRPSSEQTVHTVAAQDQATAITLDTEYRQRVARRNGFLAGLVVGAASLGAILWARDQFTQYPDQYSLVGSTSCINVTNAVVEGNDFTVNFGSSTQDPNPSPSHPFVARFHDKGALVCGTPGNTVTVDTGGSDTNLDHQFTVFVQEAQIANCGDATNCQKQVSIVYS